MEIFLLAVRSLLMVVGTLAGVLYVAGNLWQKVPAERVRLRAMDFVIIVVVAVLFALGLNSYWGLLAGVPLLVAKLALHGLIDKKRVRGSGRWMEVQWQKMMPRGFQMPKEAMQQIQRLPGDQHFIVPRFASLWAVTYFTNAMRKNAHKVPGAMGSMGGAARGQEGMAMDLVEKVSTNIKRLETGRTEKIDLPFGVLKVTRL